jgi:hypothetical protein
MSILWSSQNMERTSPLRSSHRDGQKTYMEHLIRSPDEGVMPLKRCSAIGTPDPSWDFRRPGLLTRVGTSDRPNKKGCSDLDFWMSIRTVLNSWETWKIRLGEVSYWDKTTPSIYIRGSWPIEYPSIQSTYKQNNLLLLPLFSSHSTSMLFIPWSTTKDGALGSPADLGQPGDVLALTGSLPGESFDGSFASLPEN